MTEIILVVTVSLISLSGLVWFAYMATKFLKYFSVIVEEVIDERKEDK